MAAAGLRPGAVEVVAQSSHVKDDCGTPFDAGSVTMTFSSGDAPLKLTPVKGGRWKTTWNTRAGADIQTVVKIQAADASGKLAGERQISGNLQSQTDPPVFELKGIVSAAGARSFDALVPGSIISIFGDRLARGIDVARAAPLPNALLDTTV